MSSKREVRTEKFPKMYDKWKGGQLTQAQAAHRLGIGERTFRRWSTRYRGAGSEGVRRGVQHAHGQASPAEVRALETLYREHYRDWNIRHFYEQYREAHGGGRSYKWVSKHLQAAGLVQRGVSNGRRRRNGTRPERSERQARAGALVHQAGRRDEWVEGQRWDLIVMIDDATNRVCSGVLADEPGFWPRVHCVRESVEQVGLFDSLASARSPSDWYGSMGSSRRKRHRAQFRRVMRELGIEVVPSSSPQARGRCGRLLRTLKDRLAKEMASAEVSGIAEANVFLREYWPRFNALFAVEPMDARDGFDPLVPQIRRTLDDVFCLKEKTRIRYGDRVPYQGKTLRVPPQSWLHSMSGHAEIREYADGSLAVYLGSRSLGVYDSDGRLIGTRRS